MTLNKRLNDYLIKPFLTLVLTGVLSGCTPSKSEPLQSEGDYTNNFSYQFTNFGKIYHKYSEVYHIVTADIDGDGDQDIILGDNLGKVYLYENKIPQKNKK